MRLCGWAVVLVSLLGMPLAGLAAELVNSPNSSHAWTFEVTNGAAATISEENGALRFNVTQRGSQNWHVIAFQGKKQIRDSAQLTLRFKAKASANRIIGVNCQTDVSPWRVVLNDYHNINLTPQWQAYTIPLAFHDIGSDPVRIPIFILGDAAGTVWIKDVSVTDGAAKQFNAIQPPTTRPALTAAPTTLPSSASAEELLRDPMDPHSWHFEPNSDTKATMVTDSGGLRIDVTQASPDRWHVQLYQMPPALSAGTYTLTLTMRASAPRKVGFLIQHDGDPYELLIPPTDLQATTDWKQYKIQFALSKVFPDKTRAPALQIGDATGTLFIRSMSLVRSQAPAR